MKFHCDILLKSVFTWAAAHTQRSIDVCSGKPMLLTHTHTHTFQLTHCCEHTHIQHETHTHTHTGLITTFGPGLFPNLMSVKLER